MTVMPMAEVPQCDQGFVTLAQLKMKKRAMQLSLLQEPQFAQLAALRGVWPLGEKPAPPAGSGSAKPALDMQQTQLNWDDLASKKESRQTLLLRGLPSALCEESALKAVLRAEGLDKVVGRAKALPAKTRHSGCMLVHILSVSEVPRVAKFFHGRQFGGGMPVSVSFAPVREKAASTKRTETPPRSESETGAPASLQAASVPSLELPWTVTCNGLVAASGRCSDSTSSTPPSPLPFPPGLSPPPGLELPARRPARAC
jgi:hypothetical protein